MTIKYTPYTPKGEKDDNSYMLEETNMGCLDPEVIAAVEAEAPYSFTDADGDSYLEVSTDALERAIANGWLIDEESLPLATFFNDTPLGSQASNDHLRDLPKELKATTRANDWTGARAYFAKTFGGGKSPIAEATSLLTGKNPLKKAADTLAAHLKATAFHGGMGLHDKNHWVELENDNGFSVRSEDQRLRLDCKLFAQLGHSDLKGIPGLKFQYIAMTSGPQDDGTPTTSASMVNKNTIKYTPRPDTNRDKDRGGDGDDGHMILLVSDGMGRHLIVDNDKAEYFETRDPYSEIKFRYAARGFAYFSYSDHYSKSAPRMPF